MTIPLTQDKVALIDDTDWPTVSKYTWCAHRNHHTFYAATNIRVAPGKWKTLHMHSLLLKRAPGQVIDHINRNGLDNRRSNIRICTPSENGRNSTRYTWSNAHRRGVGWYGRYGNWKSRIWFKGRDRFLGYFADKEDARLVADVAHQILYPEEYSSLRP